MKLHGIGGVGTGKLGSMVYSVRNGQQIVRQYNPIVANPSTDKQVAVRSKMKLMSQLAAIVAPVIAIKAEGLKTKRNRFISRNYDYSKFQEEQAEIALDRVQLTASNTAFPDFEVSRSDGQSLAIHLMDNANNLFDKVVYCAIIKQADGSLRLWDDVVVSDGGAGGLFPGILPYTPNDVCIYGYGIRANSDAAKAAFGDLKVPTAGNIASILTSRSEIEAGTTISETKGAIMLAGETDAQSDATDRASIQVSIQGLGTVAGAGRYEIGSQCTLVATAGTDAEFLKWTNAQGQTLSTNPSYSFVVSEDIQINAVFSAGRVTINATAKFGETTLENVSITGTGRVEGGSAVTLSAPATATYNNEQLVFNGWYDGNTLLSRNRQYTFNANSNKDLIAKYEEGQKFTVSASVDPVDGGTVTGAGEYAEGATCVLSCTPESGRVVDGWYINGEKVASTSNYQFVVSADITVVVKTVQDDLSQD